MNILGVTVEVFRFKSPSEQASVTAFISLVSRFNNSMLCRDKSETLS